MTSYEAAVRDFKWDLPEKFNFGRDVVDATAATDDRLALVWTSDDAPTRKFNFSDISVRSSQIAGALRRAGVKKGDCVIVQLPRIPEWHLTMTACTKLGAIAIPCIEMLTAKDLAYRIAHSQAAAVVTTPDNTPKYEDGAPVRVRACFGSVPGWISLDSEAARESGAFECADVGLENPALMHYTSGSTGNPKGVLHASRALFAWRLSAIYWQGIGRGDLNWCTADTGWAKAGTGVLFAPWGAGSAVLFHHGTFDPARRLQIIQEHRVTAFCAAATEFRHMIQLDLSAYDFSSLKRCVSSGEAVNPEIVKRWKEQTGVNLFDGYGQTETLMTILNYEPMKVKPGSMGRPLPGTHFEILGPDGEILGPNAIGQIAMRLPSPQFMLGYWNDAAKTQENILKSGGVSYWMTGDLGYRDEDEYFFYTGRNDDVISSAGYRIGPNEVENALITHSAVVEAAAIGKPDAERGEIVKAFVILRHGFVPDEALAKALQEHVKRTTAPYKYPREIEFVTELPKTASGKLLRRVLRDGEAKKSRDAMRA
ncbi:acyl-CoA synthetase [Noviherbaspirillum denitrificans]|uniref:Acyl-CoA synthetase n=2 Tax=Noviherbaspirillum denitrificans TaxID=1968433 RepID=A0A254TBG5_9BURK|nr:acyl-CoA synthetase [Noviherbaspirillum denitrificans]